MAIAASLVWISVSLLVCYTIVRTVSVAFKYGLRSIPGPIFARFSYLPNVRNAMSGEGEIRCAELHEKYGPVVRTGPVTVDISDPSVIPTIYGIQSNFLKSDFYSVFSESRRGKRIYDLFSVQDPYIHKIQKRNVSSIYAMSSMLGFEGLVEDCTRVLIDKLQAQQHNSINLGRWLHWYAFDVVTKITLSEPLGFMREEKDINNMISTIEKGSWLFVFLGQFPSFHRYFFFGNPYISWLFDNIPGMAAANPLNHLKAFTAEQIAKHEKVVTQEPSQTVDFLSRLQEQQKLHPERLSEDNMITYCLTNIGAGSDTTSISLGAIMYYLIKNPRFYHTLQTEIDTFDAQGKLSSTIKFNESLAMPYLQACMKEAMRLHPAVGFSLERVVPTGGATLSGYFLPEGTVVGVNAWVIHHDKAIFGGDADYFRPERWIGRSEEDLSAMNHAFLAFGHGPRVCIGKNISTLEMSKLVPELLRRFEITMDPPDRDWTLENYGFVRQNGLICKLSPRKKISSLQ